VESLEKCVQDLEENDIPPLVTVEVKDEQPGDIFFDEFDDHFNDSDDDMKLSEVVAEKPEKVEKVEKKNKVKKKKLKVEKERKKVKERRKKDEKKNPVSTMDK
jgi:hypothetical protein